MKKRMTGLIVFLFSFQILFAQLPSPEAFLGYPIGSRFTPHWRIVEYFKEVERNSGGMVQIRNYGQSIEGRPLLVAFVSTPENISKIESIRTNNLRLASSLPDDRTNGNINAPAIVWLSYNVHGNEPSSSEAAMLTLHALVDPAHRASKEWLKNTVAIIDPCLNPDGRDRYVNWYNSVAGSVFNPSLNAREHFEPWPGGRTNHYNFDLNRDWAWQTQAETRQRMQLYHQWLPQVHVDFHEQGINNPYYFAPAAQPYHEVITPWQREFQTLIGRNHAKYFDARGWLYFTREVFDLLYPSYGDTYPIYNGAIGMTYEQGGGPRGGLGAMTEEGDTLTLADRALHHFTTSLSTMEMASRHADPLIKKFREYFQTAVTTGAGDYQSYIIKWTPKDEERIHSLQDLLQRNGIRYYPAKGGNGKGFHYDSGKEVGYTLNESDLVIPSRQAKSTLVKVLFEPNSVIVDSATYDITAWSLPYVYGLNAYASKSVVPYRDAEVARPPATLTIPADPYGFVVRWQGKNAVRFAGTLLQKGIRVRFTESPFEMEGQRFDRGSLVILRSGNMGVPHFWDTVSSIARRFNVVLNPVSSGMAEKGYDFGSDRIRLLKQRRVALLTGEGVNPNAAGEVWHFFDQEIGYPVTLINANDFMRTDWKDFDVLVMPDGNYRFLSDKAQTESFHNWIRSGGQVIAMEGAVAQLSRQEWALKSKKEEEPEEKDVYGSLRKYEERERDAISQFNPGSIYRVELDNSHPLAFGYPSHYYTMKQDDRVYEFIRESGWNVGVIRRNSQVAGFVGSRLIPRLQDGLLFGVQEIGSGTVIYLADDVLFRSFWENGKLLFANAVFLVGQ